MAVFLIVGSINLKRRQLHTAFSTIHFGGALLQDATICSFNFPNCISVRIPNRELAPLISDEFDGKETFPASTSLMISSSSHHISVSDPVNRSRTWHRCCSSSSCSPCHQLFSIHVQIYLLVEIIVVVLRFRIGMMDCLYFSLWHRTSIRLFLSLNSHRQDIKDLFCRSQIKVHVGNQTSSLWLCIFHRSWNGNIGSWLCLALHCRYSSGVIMIGVHRHMFHQRYYQ